MTWLWEWGFFLFGFAIQVGVSCLYRERVGRGHITVWHRVILLRWRIKRGKGHTFGSFMIFCLPTNVRIYYQLIPMMLVSIGLILTVLPAFISVYWAIVIVLYVDDLLHGGDNTWRKRWDMVRNKIKWKWVPAPVPTN